MVKMGILWKDSRKEVSAVSPENDFRSYVACGLEIRDVTGPVLYLGLLLHTMSGWMIGKRQWGRFCYYKDTCIVREGT